MKYMWRKLWHDLGQGWKYAYANCIVSAVIGVLFVAGISDAADVEYLALLFTFMLAFGSPLQMDKAMHLCPMSRLEKMEYLKQYYWLRFGVCFGISALVELVVVAAGWLSPAFAGIELLLLAFFALAALSTNLSAVRDKKGDCRWDTGGHIPWKKETAGIIILNYVMMVCMILFQDIQKDLWEQKAPNGFTCGAAAFLAAVSLAVSVVYIVKVLPKTLADCSDYESSCAYFRVE